MSDIESTPLSVPDPATWAEKDVAFARLSIAINAANKAALFHILAAAGITCVVVHFDGSGDSGQIEDVEAKAADQPVDLPPTMVEIAHVHWGATDVQRQNLTVRDAIESLAYAFLEDTHSGWEDHEGAYGDFIFDVAACSITLDYNERIETSEYFQHIF